MTERKKKAVTSLLMLLDSEGFTPFDDIGYLDLIRPLIRRDRSRGFSYNQIAIKYQISFAQARRISKSMSDLDNQK